MAKLRHLNKPFEVKNLRLKNRVVLPPMCQFQAKDGMPNDWHFIHYASRAVGGVGLIIIEMTSVTPDGGSTPYSLGLWNDEQRDALKRIVDTVHAQGAKIAIQIAHAGSKALGVDTVVSSSPISYDGVPDIGDSRWKYQLPHELTKTEIMQLTQAFQDAVRRAVEAGFDAIELHAAHGYLLHQFYSPKLNQRSDEYGQFKMRFGEEIIKAAKAVMPANMPLLVRISAQEYGANGFGLAYGCQVARHFAIAGADIIDVSGGGDGELDAEHTPVFHAGYQVYLAQAVKQATGLPVIAVGMLEAPQLADYILGSGSADLVGIGNGLMRDPYWLLNAQYRQNASDSSEIQFVLEPYKVCF